MTENTWPGKPGVPMHPEKDGWHWLDSFNNEKTIGFWHGENQGNEGYWEGYPLWIAQDWVYLGPVLTPDEVQNLRDDLASAERERAHQHGRADRSAAEHAREQAKRESLQKRCEEAERTALQAAECLAREMRRADALQKRAAELETALQFIKDAPDEDRKPNWNNMGSYEAGLRYCAAFARAALEGKKDE